MAKYLLTGIDNEDWKLFKADCDLQGITVKESFLGHIAIVISTFNKHPEFLKELDHKSKHGGKSK